MKKLLKYMFLAGGFCGVFSLLTACADYLDVSDEVSENLTLKEVFESPSYAKRWHGGLFNCITEYSSTGNNKVDGFSGLWCFMNGETVVSAGSSIDMMTSGFNANNARLHRWTTLYQLIRDAMVFLENVHPLGTIDDREQLTENEVIRMRAEVRYLIAYSYFSLFELYGPVPILDKLKSPEDKDLDFARIPMDEFLNKVDQMLADIIASGELPETLITKPNQVGNNRYNLNEIVRPTQTAALALRAKLWVYAASPLFNGGYSETLKVTNKDGQALFSPYNAAKWQTAKECLEALFENTSRNGHKLYTVLDENGKIDADQSLYELYQNYNDEILWATGSNFYNSATMEDNTVPRDLPNGWGHVGVSQNTVDAYFGKDGLCIDDEGSIYKEDGFAEVINPCNENKHIDHVFNMFANREPRFYLGVIYEGKSWHIQPNGRPNYRIGFAKGEPADNASADSPRAGYLLGKFKNRQIMRTGDYIRTWARPSILFRLADFYLYYAEVLNELNPNDPKIIEYMDTVRERAGIPGYRELAQLGKKNIIGDPKLQRKAVQRERQVELFAEGQRYFDIRRWMICGEGEEADQRYLYGLNMNGYADQPIGSPNSFYTRVIIENRAWRRAMYLYPIPDGEIQKSKLLVQNPLW